MHFKSKNNNNIEVKWGSQVGGICRKGSATIGLPKIVIQDRGNVLGVRKANLIPVWLSHHWVTVKCSNVIIILLLQYILYEYTSLDITTAVSVTGPATASYLLWCILPLITNWTKYFSETFILITCRRTFVENFI